MECRDCKDAMMLVACDDVTQTDRDYCWNLYTCGCGMILKEDVRLKQKHWLPAVGSVAVIDEVVVVARLDKILDDLKTKVLEPITVTTELVDGHTFTADISMPHDPSVIRSMLGTCAENACRRFMGASTLTTEQMEHGIRQEAERIVGEVFSDPKANPKVVMECATGTRHPVFTLTLEAYGVSLTSTLQ